MPRDSEQRTPFGEDSMAQDRNLNEESSAVQAHLSIMQGVIQRMAENSRSSKLWCVTIVSAVLVLVARTGNPHHTLIAVFPIVLFLVLDTYYLALERAFRSSYDSFVDKLHGERLTLDDLYKVRPGGSIPHHFFASLRSFSIWVFYPLVGTTALLVWLLMFLTDMSAD